MNLFQRFGYYFGGFAIGLVILAFFLNGKKASCDYGPEARVLKNISTKKMVFSASTLSFINEERIDTTQLNYVIRKGDVNFSESDTRKEPCGVFKIEGELNDKEAWLSIENCDSIATLQSITWK
ncbi:hypothetical protein [Lacinutrix salivirga]